MAFLIEGLIRREVLDRAFPENFSVFHYTDYDEARLVELIHHWAYDEARDAFLISTGYSRHLAGFRYVFGWRGGVAILKMEGYCLFSFVYVSEALLPCLEDAKMLIAEALRIGGIYLQGNEESSEVNRVPHADFLPYPNVGA